MERLASVLLATFAVSGCAILGVDDAAPELKVLYERTAQYHAPDRNPVVVIPGILGSKLRDGRTGTVVWGAFEPSSANPRKADGARLLALPLDDQKELDELLDEVEPDGVLDKVRIRLLGIPAEIQAYVGILSTLGVGGYRDESLGLDAIDYGDDHFTCFQFDYDWRLDNALNARRFKAFLDEKRAYVAAEWDKRYGPDPDREVKFDVVAHSMGGLLLRYFLRYGDQPLIDGGDPPDLNWAGADYVDRAVIVGTPNAGALSSLQQLVDGYDIARPIIPKYQAALLGTYPSIYELLPRPRHGHVIWDGDPERPVADIYDPELWIRNKWALASDKKEDVEFLARVLPDIEDADERRRIALAVQARILARAKAFHEAMDRPARPPEGLGVFLVAGDAEDTPETLSVDSATGAVDYVSYGPGDGTVLRSSALMDERVNAEWRPTLVSPIHWDSVTFVFANHLGLTQVPEFQDNVLYWLLEEPRDG